MKKYLLFIFSVSCFSPLIGQVRSPSSPGISVGDIVPDITISNIINYSSPSAKLSDFGNKLVILDFWATWCSSCIAHFPENYAIQQEFSDKVQVLLVSSKRNRDTEAGIIDFFNKRKAIYQFPCVVQDTLLSKLFPHSTIPHYVIIKNNKVIAVTDAENINKANINRIINETGISLYVKQDLKLKKDKPLFLAGNGGDFPANYYRSLITGPINIVGDPYGFETDNTGLVTRIYAVNQNLPSLYFFASPEFPGFEYSRMIFDIPHPEKFVKVNNEKWDNLERTFTYESSFPPVSKQKALENMKIDLDRYFHLSVDSQYHDTLCYIMRINPNKSPKKVLADIKQEMNLGERINIPKYFHNYSIESLRNELQELYMIPFFDETGYKQNVSFDFPSNILDEKALVKSLERQGIILTREKRKVTYMVFRQKNGPF